MNENRVNGMHATRPPPRLKHFMQKRQEQVKAKDALKIGLGMVNHAEQQQQQQQVQQKVEMTNVIPTPVRSTDTKPLLHIKPAATATTGHVSSFSQKRRQQRISHFTTARGKKFAVCRDSVPLQESRRWQSAGDVQQRRLMIWRM